MRALMLACSMLSAAAPAGPHLEAVPWSAVPVTAPGDPATLRGALSRSLVWLRGPGGAREYANWGEPFRQRMIRSLEALDALADREPAAFREALEQRFEAYALKGTDGSGSLHLTGYCEAWAEGSRKRSALFRFPLYRKPKDFTRWKRPHPTRLELEGRAGTGSARLKGEELVWLKDRMAAYLFHVQGSGCIELAEGGTLAVGFDGRTDHPFVPIGDLLAKDFAQEGKALPSCGAYATLRANPGLMAAYLPRNPRFVFFAETPAGPPKGAFAMGLTADRSFAADSRCLPPGAPAILAGSFGTRLAFNQDRGGAIQGPARLDLYAGGGSEAMPRSAAINGPGQAFVLLLKTGDNQPVASSQ